MRPRWLEPVPVRSTAYPRAEESTGKCHEKIGSPRLCEAEGRARAWTRGRGARWIDGGPTAQSGTRGRVGPFGGTSADLGGALDGELEHEYSEVGVEDKQAKHSPWRILEVRLMIRGGGGMGDRKLEGRSRE